MNEAQNVEILKWLELTIDSYKNYSDDQLGEIVALMHYMRIYLVEQDLLPSNILTQANPDTEIWTDYFERIQNFILHNMQATNVQKFLAVDVDPVRMSRAASNLSELDRKQMFLAGAVSNWGFTLLISVAPAYKEYSKKIWQELRRGFPVALHKWQQLDAALLGYDFEASLLCNTIEKDIITIPAILNKELLLDGNNIQTPQETHDEGLKHYQEILDVVQNPKSDHVMLLATMHFVQITLTSSGVFPNGIWDNVAPDLLKLQQSLAPIADFMKKLPKDNDLNEIGRFCCRIWYFTILAMTVPENYKDIARQIWNELLSKSDGAYDFWLKRYNHPTLNNKRTELLIMNLVDNIKKVPASLR